MNIRLKKFIATILATTMCVSLAGCGNTQTNKVTNNDNNTNDVQNSESNIVTGKYVEEMLDLNYGWTSMTSMFKLDDGSIENFTGNGVYKSFDNGITWDEVTTDYFDFVKCYAMNAAVAKDGTTVVTYNKNEDENNFVFAPVSEIINPDGTKTDIKIPSDVTGDLLYISSVDFNSDGRLFASILGVDGIYEIDTKTGEMSKYLDDRATYITANNDYLFVADFNKSCVYDLKNDCYIEDDVLNEFIKKTIEGFEYIGDCNMNAFPFWGQQNENVLYIACPKGLFRHIIGGQMVECVIEPESSVLGTSDFYVSTAIENVNQNDAPSFVFATNMGAVYNVKYDAKQVTNQTEKIVVYSLRENSSIKNAIYNFTQNNPGVKVEYLLGIESDAITEEDAIKNLNTKILNGQTPDILVMDSLPIRKYEEKGVFMDICKVMEDINNETPLYYNMVKPFYRGDKLYVAPIDFTVPVMYGNKENVKDNNNIEELASVIEKTRLNYDTSDIFGLSSARSVIKALLPIYSSNFTNAKGELDSKAVEDFLTNSKKIYDAQMNGTPDKRIKDYNEQSKAIANEYNVASKEDIVKIIETNFIDYAQGETVLGIGNIDGYFDYLLLNSMKYISGLEDTKLVPMKNQGANVYRPGTIVGISSQAETNGNKDNAIKFLKELYSDDLQQKVEDGFGLNKASLKIIIVNEKKNVNDDNIASYFSYGTIFGTSFEMVCYFPTDVELKDFENILDSLSVPYINDKTMESTLLNKGAEYLEGKATLEETINSIKEKMTVYLSE